MDLQTGQIEINVMNSPTILVRVIQIVKRRRINISSLIATEVDTSNPKVKIRFQVEKKN